MVVDSRCLRCKHYLIGNKCLAYINGIPKDFLFNKKLHNKIENNQIGKYIFKDNIV